MKGIFRKVSSLFPLVALSLAAQQATIQGVVTDESNAAVPGARLAVINLATGVTFSAVTNESGFYSVPFLTPGTYRVEAAKEGFATARRENLVLNVNQTAAVDFQLRLGTVAETIEVRAAAELIDSQTSIVGQIIDNKRIVELPLNGRNYLDLARLTAGVAPDSGSRTSAKGTFSALGQRAYQTSVLLDGIDNSSRASGGQLGFEAQAVTPSIDAVEEFKVVTNNNSAEYGFRMGGTVIVQTKSGTNELHGSLYEFLRNDKLDGTNFFAVGQPKPPYRQNQFGGTVGGPIARDRTFFFASLEGTRIRLGETTIATVPRPELRNGDFSAIRALFDPATTRQEAGRWVRDPFPANRIPASRFDPVAVRVIALYPEPNLPGQVSNHFFAGSRKDDTNQIDTRVDHNFSTSHRIFGRYSRRSYDMVDPGPLPLPADGGLWTTTDLVSNSGVANWNATLSPSVNNEFRFGFSRIESLLDVPWTENFNQKLGITGLADLGDDNRRGMSRFTPTGYAEVGTRSFWPNRNNLDLLHLANHTLMVRRTHVLKAGFEYRGEELFRRAARFARGQMAFGGVFTQDPNNRGRTGDGMADFLLGLASGGTIGNQNGETAATHNFALYFQDDWRISRRLTLNLGLRWERFGPPSYKNTPVARFEVDFARQSFQIVRPRDEGDCGCRQDNNDFAPRIGFAFQLTERTVLRSGFGLFYGAPDAIAHDGSGRFYHLPPDFTEISFPTDQLVQPALIVRNGFPTGLIPATTVQENVTVRSAYPFIPTQYASQWFLDVQRELPGRTVLTLSYLGAATRHMIRHRNLNQPLTPGPGALRSRRPMPFFAAINLAEPSGNSSYNGFAAKAEKRDSGGLTLLASYTWSHTIDDGAGTLDDGTAGGGVRDAYNLRVHRGNSAYDLRHNFVAAGVYDLPVGKGRRWLNRAGAADWILGGWQIGGIVNFRTGRPFSPTITTDLSNTGTTNYPNRIASGVLPAPERTLDRWFDLAAFTIPAQFTYGNSGRNILFGPGLRSADLKIGKNFYFAERYRLEFRTEMFNFTNTPAFGLPNASVNLAQAGQIRSAGEPRRIQFGLKFVF
jgi:hypothetical protein